MKTHTSLSRGQQFRRALLFVLIMLLPVIFNWFSPVLIIFAGMEGIINMSFLMFAIMFISSLFLGRVYCTTLCPWGAWQESLGNVVSKKLSPRKKSRNRKIKYFVFVAWIATILIPVMGAGGYSRIDLAFPGGLISLDNTGPYLFWFIILGLLVTFVLASGNRGFCNYACPMGVIGIIGTKIKNLLKYPSLHLEARVSNCIQCRKCTDACVMSLEVHELVRKKDMNVADCIMCGACTSSCPNGVISYAWKWKKDKNQEKLNNLEKKGWTSGNLLHQKNHL